RRVGDGVVAVSRQDVTGDGRFVHDHVVAAAHIHVADDRALQDGSLTGLFAACYGGVSSPDVDDRLFGQDQFATFADGDLFLADDLSDADHLLDFEVDELRAEEGVDRAGVERTGDVEDQRIGAKSAVRDAVEHRRQPVDEGVVAITQEHITTDRTVVLNDVIVSAQVDGTHDHAACQVGDVVN